MWIAIVCIIVVVVGFVAFTGAPYVPSLRRDVRRAFTELYPLSDQDVVVDIGSGDGIVLREASARGARAVGYEIHPILVLISRWLSRKDERVEVRQSNFWKARLPDDMTVAYIFGDSRDITKMVARVQSEVNRIGQGVALISYAFTTDQLPDKTIGAHHVYHLKPLQEVDAPL